MSEDDEALIARLCGELTERYRRVRLAPPSGERERARVAIVRQIRLANGADMNESRAALTARIRHDLAEIDQLLPAAPQGVATKGVE